MREALPQPLGPGSQTFFRREERARPQPAPGLASGKAVGDFRLVSLIGQGGLGQVWEAEQVSLHRTVAVKFVRPERVTERQLELFAREARAGGRLHPVEQVSWEMCVETLARLGLVLRTEAQWEYGCRAGTSSVYWCGDEKESLQGVASLSDAYGKSHGNESWVEFEAWLDDGQSVHAEVGSYRANGFGLHGVHGNVWEWCRDGQAGYGNRVRAGDGEREAAGSRNRVYRGGGFDDGAANARSGNRDANSPANRGNSFGLRCARSVIP